MEDVLPRTNAEAASLYSALFCRGFEAENVLPTYKELIKTHTWSYLQASSEIHSILTCVEIYPFLNHSCFLNRNTFKSHKHKGIEPERNTFIGIKQKSFASL